MIEHEEPPVVASYPAMLDALGDEDQLLVFRSPALREDDSEMFPVRERIERYNFVLADEITVNDPEMMFGRKIIQWWMPPNARRDGDLDFLPAGGLLMEMSAEAKCPLMGICHLVNFDRPDALRRMWDAR